MEQMLSGKEKNNYMRARSKFWKITKTAMEDEEQKSNEGKVNDREPIEEANSDKYTWEQINNAFMSQGTPPNKILRFLSVLKRQK